MGIRVSFLHVWPLWLLHLSTGEIQEVGLLPLGHSSPHTNVQTPWDIPEWGNIGWAKFRKKADDFFSKMMLEAIVIQCLGVYILCLGVRTVPTGKWSIRKTVTDVLDFLHVTLTATATATVTFLKQWLNSILYLATSLILKLYDRQVVYLM